MSSQSDPTNVESDPSKKRRHARVSIPLLVSYRFERDGPQTMDYALNISQSGLFLPISDIKPPGTEVFVCLTTREGELLEGKGEIVRAGEGYAIELVGFDEQAHKILDRMVQQTLAKKTEKKVGRKSGAFKIKRPRKSENIK